MEDTKRTAGPWIEDLNGACNEVRLIDIKDGEYLCTVETEGTFDNPSVSTNTPKAEFIMRACNSHEELLRQLKNAVKRASFQGISEAVAAIAKAEGKDE